MNLVYHDGRSAIAAHLMGQVLTLENGASHIELDLSEHASDVVKTIDVFADPAGELSLAPAVDRAYAAHITIPALPPPDYNAEDGDALRPFAAQRTVDTEALLVELRAVAAHAAEETETAI